MGSKTKKKFSEETPTSSSPSSSEDSESSSKRGRRHRKDRNRRDRSSRREKERKREKRKRKEQERGTKKRKSRRDERNKRKRSYESETESDSGSESRSGSDSERDGERAAPEVVVRDMLKEFPNVGGDLRQLLQMIDDGQAVDIKGISERSLIKHLKKLFLSLNLKESGDRVFLLPSNVPPTLDVVGHLILDHMEEPEEKKPKYSVSEKDVHAIQEDGDGSQMRDENNSTMTCPGDDSSAPKRRVIGPEMPSAELLAAAAKLTEAQDELREAELEEDNELFIGPPPPAVVAEAESANEAERFEESGLQNRNHWMGGQPPISRGPPPSNGLNCAVRTVQHFFVKVLSPLPTNFFDGLSKQPLIVTRIMAADADSPYDVLGANQKTSADNIKKRYWKLSLLVHPDKCPHPQAHQAFIILNKAFKELQDPDKRKAMDDKIKLKEEQEAFKAELRAMREAAQWRRLQGISMEGDDELLADMEVKAPPQRDEWMTTLPPERKPGVTMQTTKFSRGSKEGRGDTSVWTDTPSDRAQKAKMNYLEAYNEAAALASNEEEKQRQSSDADLVDIYNKEKRSKSLVQKHQEKATSRSKKKSKQEPEKEEWVGSHPWKPWDREKDLVAGRQSIKFDAENLAQGLTSRFSSGNFQRNFL